MNESFALGFALAQDRQIQREKKERTAWHILNCGVCGEEHWHDPKQSEVICQFCEQWANEIENKNLF